MANLAWIALKPKGKRPELHVGVLIRTLAVGPVYDVACYTGKDKAGNEQWIMADITIDPKSITHFAYIEEPEEE